MESLNLSDPLPKSVAKILVALVDRAQRDETFDVLCATHSPDGLYYYVLIGDGTDDSAQFEIPKGDPITSLEKLGYLETQENGHVFLLSSAYHRAKYERKNRFGKWIDRTIENGRDILLGISFTLSLLLTLKELFFK